MQLLLTILSLIFCIAGWYLVYKSKRTLASIEETARSFDEYLEKEYAKLERLSEKVITEIATRKKDDTPVVTPPPLPSYQKRMEEENRTNMKTGSGVLRYDDKPLTHEDGYTLPSKRTDDTPAPLDTEDVIEIKPKKNKPIRFKNT